MNDMNEQNPTRPVSFLTQALRAAPSSPYAENNSEESSASSTASSPSIKRRSVPTVSAATHKIPLASSAPISFHVGSPAAWEIKPTGRSSEHARPGFYMRTLGKKLEREGKLRPESDFNSSMIDNGIYIVPRP